jgi:hypothetical protein
VLAEGSSSRIFGASKVVFVVNIVVSFLRVPFGVAHLIFLQQVFLRAPHFFRTVRILRAGEWPLVFRNVHLIVSHEVMESVIHLVLEPSVWHTQVVIGMNTDGELSGNRIPGVLVHFPDGSVSVTHLSHFIISCRGPQDLNLLSLGVGDNLTAAVGLVRFIEDINSKVHNHVGEVDFFIRSETELLDAKGFSSGEAGNTAHDLFNVSGLEGVIPRSSHLTVGLSHVFHVERSIIGRNRSRLSNRVDVTHIVNGRSRVAVEGLDVGIDVFGTIYNCVTNINYSTYVGSSSGTRDALNARGLNGPPENALI